MSDAIPESERRVAWNVFADPWLEVVKQNGESCTWSPAMALKEAGSVRCLSAGNPLDLFAAHRFLLTLLYWKAATAGGVEAVRTALLKGEVPGKLLDALNAESRRFGLFDQHEPFLQDVSLGPDNGDKSAGSLFAEFACGTNIAHFHHGDDEKMRLCLCCATIGMLRLVPWTQSGGAGLSPSVHNAPPIIALAMGKNLAETLGLNLVPVSAKAGKARWTGHFVPSDRTAEIPCLEALTWNPRRVHLGAIGGPDRCWRCGKQASVVVGPIAYQKNEDTAAMKSKDKSIPFQWQDPAAFYAEDAPYTTMKSGNEEAAAGGRDVARLVDRNRVTKSNVVGMNQSHRDWQLVVPCTNPANNKTFDHRWLQLAEISPDAIRSVLPAPVESDRQKGIDGWTKPGLDVGVRGAERFVWAAASLLTHGDWAVLSGAAYRSMHDSPAAFDVFTGLYWSLRKQDQTSALERGGMVGAQADGDGSNGNPQTRTPRVFLSIEDDAQATTQW